MKTFRIDQPNTSVLVVYSGVVTDADLLFGLDEYGRLGPEYSFLIDFREASEFDVSTMALRELASHWMRRASDGAASSLPLTWGTVSVEWFSSIPITREPAYSEPSRKHARGWRVLRRWPRGRPKSLQSSRVTPLQGKASEGTHSADRALSLLVVSGDDKNFDVGTGLCYSLGEFNPGHSGHHNVGQQQIERDTPVWSKYSSGPAVVSKQATKAVSTADLSDET